MKISLHVIIENLVPTYKNDLGPYKYGQDLWNIARVMSKIKMNINFVKLVKSSGFGTLHNMAWTPWSINLK